MGGHWYVIGARSRPRRRAHLPARPRARRRALRDPPRARLPRSAGVRSERLPQPRALAARRGRRARDDPGRARGRLAGRARRRPVRHDRAPRRPLAALHDPVADWQELAGWLIGLDGLASPSRRPSSSSAWSRRSSASPPTTRASRQPHAVPLSSSTARAAPERGESPVTPERFAVLQAMLADVLAACGERKDAMIDAAELQPRFKLDRRGARGSPAAAQPRQLRRRLLRRVRRARRRGAHDPRARRSSTATSSAARRGSRRSRPRRSCWRSTSSARSWPPTPARRSTTCAPSSRRRSAATTCAARPRRSRRHSTRTSSRCSPRRCAAAPSSRSSTSAARPTSIERRVVEPHYLRGVRGDWYCDTWDRTRDGERTLPRRPHPRGPGAGRDVRAPRERDRARRRRARRSRRHGLGVVLGRGRALGARGHGPTRRAWPTAPRSRPSPTAPSAGSAPSSAATWARPSCSSPSRCAPGSRRAHASSQRSCARTPPTGAMTAPQARWLSEAEVAALLPPPREAAELARSVLVGLAEGTIELPPKPAIHPRPDAFVNMMPAYSSGLTARGRQARERLHRESRARAARDHRRS